MGRLQVPEKVKSGWNDGWLGGNQGFLWRATTAVLLGDMVEKYKYEGGESLIMSRTRIQGQKGFSYMQLQKFSTKLSNSLTLLSQQC